MTASALGPARAPRVSAALPGLHQAGHTTHHHTHRKGHR